MSRDKKVTPQNIIFLTFFLN